MNNNNNQYNNWNLSKHFTPQMVVIVFLILSMLCFYSLSGHFSFFKVITALVGQKEQNKQTNKQKQYTLHSFLFLQFILVQQQALSSSSEPQTEEPFLIDWPAAATVLPH